MNGVEALWAAEFQANTGWGGAGVVVFESGRIFGGDASYYYLGTYSVDQGRITARVEVIHYHGQKNNIFGPIDRVTLDISGQLSGNLINGQGSVVGAPGRQMALRMSRLADLP